MLIIDDAHLLAPTQVRLLAEILRKRRTSSGSSSPPAEILPLPIVELELRGDASVIRATAAPVRG